jgi:hypothetical protein
MPNFPSNYICEIQAWVILRFFQVHCNPVFPNITMKQSQYLPIAKLDTSNYYELLWKL